jgi:hypothetical protein
MGMIIAPARFGGGVAPGTFILGNNGAATGNLGVLGDGHVGTAFQATGNATANKIVIVGGSTANYPSLGMYLCVYAATSSSVWGGALLGRSALITGINIGEVKTASLLTPVSIVNGSWYALTIMTNAGAGENTAANGAFADRFFFGNAFASGPDNPAQNSSLNSGVAGHVIYLTT